MCCVVNRRQPTQPQRTTSSNAARNPNAKYNNKQNKIPKVIYLLQMVDLMVKAKRGQLREAASERARNGGGEGKKAR